MSLFQLLEIHVGKVSDKLPVMPGDSAREPLAHGIDAYVRECGNDHVRPFSSVPLRDFLEQFFHVPPTALWIDVGRLRPRLCFFTKMALHVFMLTHLYIL